MQTISNDQRNPDSEPSPSPSLSPSSSRSSSRSRSRDKEIEEEKKTRKNQQKSHNNNALIEGKLYLANIPLSIPQGKIIEEFARKYLDNINVIIKKDMQGLDRFIFIKSK